MTLRSLTLLVLAVLLGTAASVRWYLQADQAPTAARELLAPAPALEHVPLPMWAEPAPRPSAAASSRSRAGVARKGQRVPSATAPAREDPRPAEASETVVGAFRPPLDPL